MPNDFRPISLFIFLSKVLERLVNDQISYLVNPQGLMKNDLLGKIEFLGFSRGVLRCIASYLSGRSQAVTAEVS